MQRTFRQDRCGCRVLRQWFFAAALFGAAAAAPAAQEYRIGPAPGWVERVAPDLQAAPPKEQVSGGVYYLLVDGQTRAEAQGKVEYQHVAVRALNQGGVEDVANLSIGFDPAYQTLTLHSVQVHRAGKAIPKLASAKISVLQREKDLEYRIFDGRKSVNLFLDDVRVDDIVEYAFSIRGTNPVFGNRLFDRIPLQWSVPVQRVFARLLWPRGRPLHFLRHETEIEPKVRKHKHYVEYRWDVANVRSRVVENGAPAWYDPYAWVQWGEFKDWASVAQWAMPLYRMPAQLNGELKAQVERIAAASADPGQRLLAVLHFVQSQIRYLGVEIGAGSHAPSAPEVVLQRRFGDCKDKTLLMLTMLHALGIDAQAALVNTDAKRAIRDWLPTPTAFDHVIVRARISGQDYWLDPTRPPQRGNLATLFQPNFGHALIVDRATQALTPMTRNGASTSKRTVHAVIDMRAGVEQPARYTVTTVHEGASAESARGEFASSNHEALQKNYLNFYTRYYPTIKVAAPMEMRDEDRGLTVVEHYSIPDFFANVEDEKRLDGVIYAPDVAEYTRRPSSLVRHAPLAIAYPVEIVQTTEVLLPSAWEIEAERVTVDDPAFAFQRQIAYEAEHKRLVLTDRFRSLVDHIGAGDVQRYVANLDRMSDNLVYTLYWYKSPAAAKPAAPPTPKRLIDQMNWPVALLSGMILLLWSWLALRLYRYDPPPRRDPIDSKLQGIRGWLLLPALGIIVQPFKIIYDTYTLLPSYAVDTWATLTTVGHAAYHPLWAPVLLFELTANLALIVFALVLAVLFFQKRRSAPTVYVSFLAGSLIVHALDLALASQVPATEIGPKDWGQLSRGLLAVVIWGSYFRLSKRAKATFIHGRKTRSSDTDAVPATL